MFAWGGVGYSRSKWEMAWQTPAAWMPWLGVGTVGEGLGESKNDANQWIIRGAGGDDDIRGGC